MTKADQVRHRPLESVLNQPPALTGKEVFQIYLCLGRCVTFLLLPLFRVNKMALLIW